MNLEKNNLIHSQIHFTQVHLKYSNLQQMLMCEAGISRTAAFTKSRLCKQVSEYTNSGQPGVKLSLSLSFSLEWDMQKIILRSTCSAIVL